MKLLYVQEHLSCRNYISDFHIGFKVEEGFTGQEIKKGDKYYNYIIFLIEGTLSVTGTEGEKQNCQEGEMFFIGQGNIYTLHPQKDVKFISLAFDNPVKFESDLTMEDLQAYYTPEENLKVLPMCEGMRIVTNTILFYLHHKIQCKHLHAAKQQEVFMILSSFYNREELAAFFNPVLDNTVDFKSFVLNHYQDVKTVEELARLCHSSVRSLTRKFHEHFGDSPYSWMLKQRSQHIKMQIADSRIPFAEIIHEYGFSSPAHFTSFCKKYFGETPSKIRKQYKEPVKKKKK